MNFKTSRKIAAILGPVLIVMVTSELRFWNPTLYAEQITPLVYLSGILMFTAGLAILRSHNIWTRHWPVLITLIAWAAVFLGLIRIFYPQSYRAQFQNDNAALAIEIVLILIGLLLTFQAYRFRRQ
ncbi:hypothetical protein [Leptospira broomii]|nr:hypothetical protein [Leptospira broomii]